MNSMCRSRKFYLILKNKINRINLAIISIKFCECGLYGFTCLQLRNVTVQLQSPKGHGEVFHIMNIEFG